VGMWIDNRNAYMVNTETLVENPSHILWNAYDTITGPVIKPVHIPDCTPSRHC